MVWLVHRALGQVHRGDGVGGWRRLCWWLWAGPWFEFEGQGTAPAVRATHPHRVQPLRVTCRGRAVTTGPTPPHRAPRPTRPRHHRARPPPGPSQPHHSPLGPTPPRPSPPGPFSPVSLATAKLVGPGHNLGFQAVGPWGGVSSGTWCFVVLCGPLWTFVDLCGPLRTFADLCGPLWTFVDLCGPGTWSFVVLSLWTKELLGCGAFGLCSFVAI